MAISDQEGKGFTVTDRRSVDAQGEAREKPPEREAGQAPPTHVAADAPSSAGAEAPRHAPLPEIDFGMFIMSLASSALVQLGELLPPGEQQVKPNLALAKQTIDILGVLEDKTRGNLSSDEAQLLQHLLYDLRLKYVDAKNR